MIGKSIHEKLCSSPDRYQTKPQPPCNKCPIYHSYNSGVARHLETAYFRRADGSVIPVEYRSQPLLDGSTIMGAIITFADISERLLREQHLNKLSKALDYSPVAALITDRNGHIEYVNRRFIEAIGYDTDELVGNTPRLFKSGQTPASTYEAMWQQLNRGEPWYGEFLNRKKSGELFWDETAIAPIADQHGKVLNYVAFKDDVTRRKEAERRVWEQANYDTLTELPNRHYFQDQLTQQVRTAQRYNRKFALMFLDLDGFKQVNDSLGHDVGDALLRMCAQRLKEHTRSSDIVSRLGGDEFTVIIPTFDTVDDLKQVAQKVVDGIGRPYLIGHRKIAISTSLGIAVYPSDAAESTTLQNMADSAMYAAKHRGKNRFMFYESLSSGQSFDLYSQLEE